MSDTGLPQDTARQTTGRLAAETFKPWCTQYGLLFRTVPVEEDFGVDGEIEIKQETAVTGLLVKVQVKGRDGIPFTQKHAVYKEEVKSSTARYWAALPLNLLAVLVDTSNGRMYWTGPPLPTAGNPSLVFSESNRFDDKPERFRALALRRAKAPAAPSALDKVVDYIEIYLALAHEQRLGYRDFGFGADRREVLMLELLYDHVERLAIVTGAATTPPVSLEAWRARSAAFDRDDNAESGMLDRVAGEVLEYLEPRYRSVLALVRDLFAESTTVAGSQPQLAAAIASGALDEDALDVLFERGTPHSALPTHGGVEPESYSAYAETFGALGLAQPA